MGILKDEFTYERVPEDLKNLKRENTGCFKSTKQPAVYYDGDWVNGKATGQGIQYADGNLYEGFWKDGKRVGHGRMIFKSGEVYTGNWLDDKRNGHGENVWSDG